jgi:gluconolactonase
MFKAPSSVSTEVFTAVPKEFRRPGQAPAERIAAGKSTLTTDTYIEGPSFDRAGNLYFVDIAFGRIYRSNPAGEVELLIEYDGEPNGLKIHQDGRIFVADHKNGLMLFDPQTKSIKPLLTSFNAEAFKGLNDLFFASNGDLYFTDQGRTGLQDPSGRVFRMTSQGEVSCLLSNAPSPNGIVLSANGNHLFIAVTRSNSIWRTMLLQDGSITRVGNFIQMSGGSGPDGLALDQEGNLYVAHAGMGAVWKFSPKGEPLLRINSCAGNMTTNLAFGGKDNRDLFITETDSGSILIARMDAPGQTLFSHQ